MHGRIHQDDSFGHEGPIDVLAVFRVGVQPLELARKASGQALEATVPLVAYAPSAAISVKCNARMLWRMECGLGKSRWERAQAAQVNVGLERRPVNGRMRGELLKG
ncbi:MAG: hypothetical protein KJZ87_20525 [Thermoguttaceae bacterium]|nr:hypothetical protein [Thermoguttaceae bacterium]